MIKDELIKICSESIKKGLSEEEIKIEACNFLLPELKKMKGKELASHLSKIEIEKNSNIMSIILVF